MEITIKTQQVLHCCNIDCKENAEFHVQDIGVGTNYEDYTHCCAKHLPEMINDLHQVIRLDCL